jgi:hypothetical protein
MRVLTTLKTFTIVAAFLAGGTALAMAQNGPPTGGEPPVAGGANGNPILDRQSSAPRVHHRRSTYMYAHPKVFKYPAENTTR